MHAGSGNGSLKERGALCVAIVLVLAGGWLLSANRPAALTSPNAVAQPSLAERPATRARLADVVAAFHRGSCGNCHVVPRVPGADGNIGPDLSKLGAVAGTRRKGYSAEQYIRESILRPDASIAPTCPDGTCPKGVMPQSFEKTLSKNDLELIVGYLSALGTKREAAFLEGARGETRIQLDVTRPPECNVDAFRQSGRKPPGDAQLALGKYLFFDRRLSGNNSLSCASCHQPENAFTDGRAVSRGYPSTRLFRNTPTLLNMVDRKTLYLDGRMSRRDVPTIVRDHLTEAHFMSIDGRLMVERLKQIPQYVALFQQAYGNEPTFGNTLKAIAAYVQSLTSGDSPYKRFVRGDATALSPLQRQGWKLFRGKAKCARCHGGPQLTDSRFHRLGVPVSRERFDDPERQVTFRRFFRVLGVTEYRRLRADVGRFAVTRKDADRGRFRTPSLLDVARTAPYMHNGSLATLAEVVAFYNRGGGPGQTAGLSRLGLSQAEQAALVAFLESLSSDLATVRAPRLPDYATIKRPQPPAASRRHPNTSGTRKRGPVPPLGPLPAVPEPSDNRSTPEKVGLGKLLFFDPRMSGDGSISCNTCHPVGTGFAAHSPISMGGPGTSHWRNSQTLLNVGYYGKLNWDGAKSSIESQNAGAWTGAVAGNLDPQLAEERLMQIPEYRKRFQQVFGTPAPKWDDALRAVAAFQRSLVSRDVPFDRFAAGERRAISESARRGYRLFQGKANCIQCHHGPLASDDSFHALGVPRHPSFETSPLKQITFRFELASKGVPREIYDRTNTDDGLYYVTKRPEDRGKFRTPSLRGLKHTAPYMHNGVLTTLEDVVAFYNRGGGPHSNRSPLLKPLALSKAEQNDLVAFLLTLSGKPPAVPHPVLPEYGRFPFDNTNTPARKQQ